MSSRETLKIPLSEALGADAAKAVREQLYYLDPGIEQVTVEASDITVVRREMDAAPDLAERMSDLVAATRASFRRASSKMLFETGNDLGGANEDPLSHLVARGDVVRTSPGVFGFAGEFLALMQGLDCHFRDYALSLGAAEQSYAQTVRRENLTAAGYLHSFPHHALFVTGSERRIDGPDSTQLAEPEQLLAPTVCHRCLEVLQAAPRDGALFTAVAQCHRNEGFVDDSLRRLQSFRMREIVFLGDAESVTKMREDIVEHAKGFVSDFGFEARLMTATDPFFATDAQKKRGYQALSELKYEMQFRLPFADEWTSAMSFNDHRDTLVAAYGLGDRYAASGCVGYGYERLAYAVYCQFGLDAAGWPPQLQAMIADRQD